jgi:NO-binding membrane sensor protein with MHYT domain
MKLDYDFALEMANGIGFVLTLVLASVLTALLIARTRDRGWRYDQVTQLNIGMILIKIGICVRLGFGWVVVRCSNQTPNQCGGVEKASWLLFAAILLIAVGGLVVLRLLVKPSWRPWACISSGMIAFAVPFTYYAWDLMFPREPAAGELVRGWYHLDRVALSVAIAIMGSYTALEVVEHARGASGVGKALWIASAGIVMGWSIWSMHFVAMLAFELPGIPVIYDIGLTALSMALPIGLTLVGFFAVAARKVTWISRIFGGTLIAFGILCMHYVGMAAMQMPAIPTYDPMWVVISVVIAWVAAIAAVYVAFAETSFLQKLVAAVVLGGCGISGLHYSAMVAFSCYADHSIVFRLHGLSPAQLTIAVASATFAILVVFLLLSAYDRRK